MNVLAIVTKHGGQDASETVWEVWQFPSQKHAKQAFRELDRLFPNRYKRVEELVIDERSRLTQTETQGV